MSQPTSPSGSAASRVVVPPGSSHPRLRVVNHAGRQVIMFDLKGLAETEEVEALASGPFRRFMDAQAPDKACLTLVDARDTPTNAKGTQAMRDFAKANVPYVRASAVLTTTQIHRLAVSTIAMFTKRKIKAFENEREALDWLVAQ